MLYLKRRSRWIVSMFMLMLASGCSLLPSDGEVSAGVTGSELVIDNGTDERIYYLAIGEQLSAISFIALHLDQDKSIRPDGQAELLLSQIAASPDDHTAVVMWWRAEEVDGARKPGRVHQVSVRVGSLKAQ